ncbi:RNA-binding protein 12B-like isoform X1 [Bufo gargarizans]|uniref:RNA-binding protein 12B-like isoform X1 n=1 Tax=Bufo gargarizans TaxID=30331 RepID=UPI001CF1B0FB|nr:RNA-binding protein 12B-like isoform X1 [Bufo gargarizans]XP_044149529.1 RNA-binding protein 12B-like isoform X1 [Bufo gargarizans]XP_044149530.1 RNA-binding protein 12B-like isoform X1 [Bufo gargarizans]
MAVVIRLQGLPVVAGSVDIRHFFTGLQIPDGGVHIIGGNHGEAFVIFATDEDARRAMSRTGGIIKSAQIQLLLSSKTEMQNTLEMSRKTNKNPKHPAVPPSGDMNRSAMVKKGPNQNKFEKKNYDSDLQNSGPKHRESYGQKYDTNEVNSSSDDVYVSLYGLPYSATEEEIRNFFKGLDVADIIFTLRPNGLKNGNGYAKFRSAKDAEAALAFHNQYIGHRFISISKASEEKWVMAGGKVGEAYSKQPRRRTRSRSPQNQQFYVHLKNLPYVVEKEDIKRFFGVPDIEDSQIKLLFDKQSSRLREGFVMLKSEWQYEKCLSLHKSNFKGRPLFILPVPRKAMLEIIESYETKTPPKQERPYEDYARGEPSSLKRCIYIRNFPFDVTKVEVQKFFTGFFLHEDDIILLFDNKGVGLGEALVKFPSEEQALRAEGLNRQQFLGTEVLLRRISEGQMKEFSPFNDAPVPVYRNEYTRIPLPEGPDRSYGLPEFERREFRGSPERISGSYPMEYAGGDESFDMGNNHIDYDHYFSAPHHNFDSRSAGAVIHMKNLPYTITIAEISDFFYGYNVIPDSIDIKFNRKGMATGHATACTNNYDEAMAAVNELNERPIGSRKIYLTLNRI